MLDDERRYGKVLVTRVDARPHADLRDLRPRDLTDGNDLVRVRGERDERLQRGQVDDHLFVVPAAGVGEELPEVLPSLLSFQVLPTFAVAREDAGRRAELQDHVADRGPLGGVERGHARSVELVGLVDASLHGQTAKHLQDDVLGRDPGLEFVLQHHPDDRRTLQLEWKAGHGDGGVHATDAERERAERAGGGGV